MIHHEIGRWLGSKACKKPFWCCSELLFYTY